METLINKAHVLLEALPYIQKFKDAIFVVKYGGSFMDSPDPAIRTGVARDIVFLEAVGIRPVVIHGGGKAISKAMSESGHKAIFVQGYRVTDEKTMAIVENVLSHQINSEIVEAIKNFNGKAVGFSGSKIFKCKKMCPIGPDGQQMDIGFVGEVIDVIKDPIIESLEADVTPVISPTATGLDGCLYNCNADTAAAAAAIALNATRLVFMSDVPGVLENPDDPSSVITHLSISDIDILKSRGIITKGMIPKIESAVSAIKAGVKKVSLVDGRIPHAILLEIFTDAGIGTELVP